MKRNIAEEIESLIDDSSLTDVLTAIELVCLEKAEHLRANWQDTDAAKSWESDAKQVYKATQKINN
jgi:hypothetical protein